jgi:hypothetical protein
VPLPDLVAIGLLLRAFPVHVVDGVLGDLERREGRRRLLPARLVVYDVMAMGLFPDESYEQVMRSVSAGLAWSVGLTPESGFPSKVALAKARRRLGHEPLRTLFEWAGRAPFGPSAPAHTVAGRVVHTLSARRIDLADTAANAAAFGRERCLDGPGAPRTRVVGLVESGSEAVLDLAVGSLALGDRGLAAGLGRSLRPGSLVVVDQGCVSPGLLMRARSVGAELLWPAGPAVTPFGGTRFADGSFLTTLHAKTAAGRADGVPLPVRVVECVVEGAAGTPAGQSGPDRLLTSILDPVGAPAGVLVDLHAGRRGLDAVFDALTANRESRRLTVRSKTPEGVLQELYALLCLYHALRHLFHGGA